VTIHDSGTAAGCHYFVMDYVSGQPLDLFMSGAAHSIRNTLTLFAQICEAVNAAHVRGITHRDLKPGNIRVDENAAPRILDFGLAKIAGTPSEDVAVTLTGQFLGSLPWASPEQVEGNPDKIDLRTDVYSLGVVLFQMLTSKFPYEVIGPMREVMDRVIHAQPARPRAIRKQIDDEVETIILKCLQKDRERRYQTAGELGRDVRRYLAGVPIEAKRDSVGYLLRKYLGRHRVAAAVAGVFVLLLAGFGVTMSVYAEINHQLYVEAENARRQEQLQRKRVHREAEEARLQAQRADQERRSARRSADFMGEMLGGVKASVALGRDTMLLDDMLNSAADRIEKGELADSPEAELRLRWTIGETYIDIARDGAIQRAETILLPALAQAERLHGAESEQMATSLNILGYCLQSLGRATDALPKFEAALEIKQRLFKSDHRDLAAALNNLAYCLDALNRAKEALPMHEAALAMNQRLFNGDHSAVARGLNNTGLCLKSLGRAEEALPKFEAALQMWQRLYGGDHPEVATGLNNLASCLVALGRTAEALPLHETALDMNQRLIHGDHPNVAGGMNNVASCLDLLGRASEALPKYEAALEMYQRLYQGRDHRDVVYGLNNEADCLHSLGRVADALAKYEAALEMRQRLLEGRDHPHVAMGLNNVAFCLEALGRGDEALPKYEAALEMTRRLHREADHPQLALYMNNVAFCLRSMGRVVEALPKFEAVIEMRRRLFHGDHPDTAQSLNSLGDCLNLLNRTEEALLNYEAALRMCRRMYSAPDPLTATLLLNVANAMVSLGRAVEAEPLAREAVVLHRANSNWPAGEATRANDVFIKTLVSLAKTDEAIAAIVESLTFAHATLPLESLELASALAIAGGQLLALKTPAAAKAAEPMLRECLAIREKLLPDGHPQVWLKFNSMSMLGESLVARCAAHEREKVEERLYHLREAERLILDSHERLKDDPNVPPPSQTGGKDCRREALQRVIGLYEAWGKPDQADEYRAQLSETKLSGIP